MSNTKMSRTKTTQKNRRYEITKLARHMAMQSPIMDVKCCSKERSIEYNCSNGMLLAWTFPVCVGENKTKNTSSSIILNSCASLYSCVRVFWLSRIWGFI